MIVKKRSAERTLVDRLAMHLYDPTFLVLGNSMLPSQFGITSGKARTYSATTCDRGMGPGWCLDWCEAWSLLNLDLATASVYLNLFSGTDQSAMAHMADAQKFEMQLCHPAPETLVHMYHALGFVNAKFGMCIEALAALKHAQHCRLAGGLGPDAGLEKDIEKQAEHLKVCNPGHSSKESRLCLCCSTFKDQICESRTSTFGGTKPAGIVGWVDLHHDLTDANLQAMGVSKKDVPVAAQAPNPAPVCI